MELKIFSLVLGIIFHSYNTTLILKKNFIIMKTIIKIIAVKLNSEFDSIIIEGR